MNFFSSGAMVEASLRSHPSGAPFWISHTRVEGTRASG